MILYPATSTHNHSVPDWSGYWSTSVRSDRVARGKALIPAQD